MRLHLAIKSRGDLPPCQSVTIGKLDFRRYTTVNAKGKGAIDQTYMGAVGEYSDEDVKDFEARAKNLVVRWGWKDGADGRSLHSATIFDKRVPDYFETEDDEPLRGYLTLTPVGVDAPHSIGTTTPEQVAALASARASEERARQDPRDARERAKHTRAKRDGESVEG